MNEGSKKLVRIVPQWDDVPVDDREWLLATGVHVIGRDSFGINCKQVSRKHCEISVSEEKGGRVVVILTPRSTNPMVLKSKGGKEYRLSTHVQEELRSGDMFFLTTSAPRFPFRVELLKTNKEKEAEDKGREGTIEVSPEIDVDKVVVTGHNAKKRKARSTGPGWSGQSRRRRVVLTLSSGELDEASACEIPNTQSLVESVPVQSHSLEPAVGPTSDTPQSVASVAGSVPVVLPEKKRRPIDSIPCFRNIAEEKFYRILALSDNSPPHDPASWKVWFNLYSSPEHKSAPSRCGMRLLVQYQTFRALADGCYRLPDGSLVPVDRQGALEAAARSVLQLERSENSTPEPLNAAGEGGHSSRLSTVALDGTGSRAQFSVVNVDCLQEALRLKSNGFSVAVLNMANRDRPGGRYLEGSGAQEENIHRRSSLFWSLDDPNNEVAPRDWSYPLPDFGGIYSPDVLVFRGPEHNGYPFLTEPEELSFITVAADYKPGTERGFDGSWRLKPDPAARLSRKIRLILDMALDHGHDAVVLSAFGCGAFRAPPAHVAEVFRETIFKYSYHRRLRSITFAIIDDDNAHQSHNPEGNFIPFQRIFSPYFV